VEFRGLSDFGWGVVRPFLPPRSRVGRPRADDRVVLNGVQYVLTTGCRWMDIPLGIVSVDSSTVEAKGGRASRI
jgi:transposase